VLDPALIARAADRAAPPLLMGVLNVTPDSFSDGGEFSSHYRALKQAHVLIAEGADIIDVGGESTRPGAAPVPVDEELGRVIPLIDALRAQSPVAISIDSSKPEVMRAAVAAGASLINDVRALRAPGALETARALGVPVCLMHMAGDPETMQREPSYADVVADVVAFLTERSAACIAAGVAREHVWIDPGFGFGKTLANNLALLANLNELAAIGFPVLIGVSRKSMIGALTGRPVEQRVTGSVAAALIAFERGARILRVHDVAQTRDAIAVARAVANAERTH
jgi:dihydropteroate synthase